MSAIPNEKLFSQPKTKSLNDPSFFQTIWRWHFYAGLIFAPFLIILAFSGAVYLFKPQIESSLYQDLYYTEENQSNPLPPAAQSERVKETYPDRKILSMKFFDESNRSTEIGMLDSKGQMYSVFIDPYSGKIAGELKNEEKFTEQFKKLHSELLIGGTPANLLVELAACWAVILLGTGLYIWWPRNKSSLWGTVLPRLHKKGRVFWRDMHAVPAFWLSSFILILIATGLPWSGVMGEQINRFSTSTNTGYPAFAFSFGEKPESIVHTKDVVQDGPWATENLPVPHSEKSKYVPLDIDDAVQVAQQEKIKKPYTISMPQGEKGVYTIATSHSKPGNNATLHVDQYSGSILSDVRYSDCGITAKAITLGIALHEGRLFGLANQIIGLLTCLGLIGLVISSLIMWKKRKPKGKIGAPAKSADKRTERIIFGLMLLTGMIMPLVGASIVLVYLLDRFILRKSRSLS